MNYQDKLNPWTIVRVLPDLEHITVARFRRRSDAEGQLIILKQMMPQAQFEIVFQSGNNAVGKPPILPEEP